MSIASTASSKVLTHYLRESPDLIAQQLSRQARMWDIAAKVTLAALFVITSAVMIMAVLGTAILTPGYLAIALGLAIATPILYHYERKFAIRSQQLTYDALVEKNVAEYLRQLKSWKSQAIADFYKKHRITAETNRSLLPLIARFNFWEQVAANALAEAYHYLNDELAKNQLVKQPKEILNLSHQHGWKIIEEVVLPAKLQSAVTIGLLHNPNREIELSKIGQCVVRPIEQNPSEQDNYFTFASKRPPITIHETLVSTPDELSRKLLG